MWQYLFLRKSIDCPLEHRAYCRLYHICFGGREEYDEWIELNQGRSKLEKELKRLAEDEVEVVTTEEKDGKKNSETKKKEFGESETKARIKKKEWLNEELKSVKEAIRVRKEVAVVRGAVESNRVAEGENLYGDEGEPGVEGKIFTATSIAPAVASTSLPLR